MKVPFSIVTGLVISSLVGLAEVKVCEKTLGERLGGWKKRNK